jgi:ABC-type uncharacterized transport system fused permease/ATPase subunit
MDNSIFSLAGTLGGVWHILAWVLAIVLGTLWSWTLIASWQQAKSGQILQDWLSRSQTSNLRRPDASSLTQEPDAKMNSAVVSRTTTRAAHRHGF